MKFALVELELVQKRSTEKTVTKKSLEMMPMKSAGMTPVDACTFTATKICPKAELLMAPFYEYNVWRAHKDNVYGKVSVATAKVEISDTTPITMIGGTMEASTQIKIPGERQLSWQE